MVMVGFCLMHYFVFSPPNTKGFTGESMGVAEIPATYIGALDGHCKVNCFQGYIHALCQIEKGV